MKGKPLHGKRQASDNNSAANAITSVQKVKKKKMNFFRDILNNPVSYMLCIPAAIYTFIFGYCTIPYMIIAFQKFNFRKGLFGSEWVGLTNFEFFFKSNDVGVVIGNTLKLNFLFIVFTTVTAVLLSIMLNEIGGKWFKKITQSTFLFPYFISWVIVNYILYGILSTDAGLFNNMRALFGMEPISFYTNSEYWTVILTILKVWKDIGYNAVIYLAVITGFDTGIYEAATIDGASRAQICRKLTIPMLMPTVVMLSIMAIGKIFYGDFGMIYAIIGDNGVLYQATDVIDTFIFRTLRTTGNPSQAMAIGLFQAVMGFILVCGSNWITRKKFSEGALF